jgi:hypothetical protein
VTEPGQPKSMRRAVALMYTGASLSFVLTVTGGIMAQGAIREAQLFAVASLAAVVVGGLLPCCLWLWMAWKNGAGRQWARVVSTIFFALGTVELIPELAGRATALAAGAGAEWLIGLVTIILLYARESSHFFAFAESARAMRRYQPPHR